MQPICMYGQKFLSLQEINDLFRMAGLGFCQKFLCRYALTFTPKIQVTKYTQVKVYLLKTFTKECTRNVFLFHLFVNKVCVGFTMMSLKK